MSEFKSDGSEFYRSTRKRVIYELLAFCSVALFFWTDYSILFQDWLKISILVVFLAYILFGLALYPKAKAVANNFSISLLDDTLIFPAERDSGRIAYSDLVILGTKSKDNEISKISLRTSYGQKIEIQGLNNMQDLYD